MISKSKLLNSWLQAAMVSTKKSSKNSASKSDNSVAPTPTPSSSTQQSSAISLNEKGQIILRIHAKPGAKKSAITNVGDEEIGVAIAAPPRDGAANEELISSMIQFLGLRKAEIAFDKGAKSRSKILLISTQRFTKDEIEAKLKECAAEN